MNSESQAPLAANQTLRRVGHCLHRSENSRIYYAILKRAGKQIKRSPKTSDKGLAKRQFSELQEKASRLNREDSGKISLEDPVQFLQIGRSAGMAKRWQVHPVAAAKNLWSRNRLECRLACIRR